MDYKSVNVGNKANGPGTKGSVDSSSNSLKGAIVHVCKDRCWFKTYESLNDGSILHMGNESIALVHGRGCVDLRLSSGKIVSLNIVNDNIASAFMSTSKLNDSILWHARLGHVHFKKMQDMSKDGLIPAFDIDTEEWNKKYFVTFIDDASRFCYVYLLHSKDEALDKFKVLKTKVELQLGSLIKRFRTDRGGEYMDTLNFQAVVRLPDPKLKNLGERGIECIFIGYAEHSKAFRFYVIEPNDSVSINSIIESRDVIFDENRFSSVPRSSLRIPNGTEDIGGSMVSEEVTKEVSNQHSYCFNVDDDPKIFDESMKSQDVAFWKEAINDEMDSIMGKFTVQENCLHINLMNNQIVN
ncbi:zinc finger, CCHC-type containing protein [Tanacetum coccineum]